MARHLVRSDVSGSQAFPSGRGKALGGKGGKGLGIARGKTAKRHRYGIFFSSNKGVQLTTLLGRFSVTTSKASPGRTLGA